MLTRNIQRTVPVPHEPGQTFTFRQLSWVQLQEAEEARSTQVLRNLRNMGGELLRDLQGAQIQTDTPTAPADPVGQLDRATLLKHGIVAWTYPESVTIDNISQLDPVTAEWAANEIYQMGRPPLVDEQTQTFLGSASSSMASPALTHLANGSSASSATSSSAPPA